VEVKMWRRRISQIFNKVIPVSPAEAISPGPEGVGTPVTPAEPAFSKRKGILEGTDDEEILKPPPKRQDETPNPSSRRRGVPPGAFRPKAQPSTIQQTGYKEATPLLTPEGYNEIYKSFPEGVLSRDRARQLVDGAVQSTIKMIGSVLTWRPLDAEAPETKINSIPLENLKLGLTAGVNKVNYLLEQATQEPDKARKNYLQAATLSSKMLQQILGNEDFRKSIRGLAQARKNQESQIAETIISLEQLEAFFEKEYALLIENNVPMADILINEGRKAIVDVQMGKAPATKIYEAIERLRIKTSTLQEELTSQINRERTVRILKKAALGIGASAVAIVNIQAEATLTLPLATLSGHMAAGIIGAAASDVWSL
jgi:hypothetical protein